MASPSYTYTLTNGTTADASQVQQNFTDILNGVTDGTKDLSISALTVAGTATLNGNINLGNAAADDLTITASLASSIPVKTTATYNIGAATLGILSVYFGRNSQSVRVIGSASMSATYTLTLPTTAGTKGYVPYNSDGSATLTWTHGQTGINSVSGADYTVLDGDGYGTIIMTTGASDRTVTLPTAADNTGRRINFVKADTGAGLLIVDGEGAETIDGLAQVQVAFQYDQFTLVCDGTGWYYVGSHYQSSNASLTFTFNGSGGNVSAAVPIYRRGRTITAYFSTSLQATTGTSSTGLASGTIPTWAQTSGGATAGGVRVRNNNGADATGPGYVSVSTVYNLARFQNANYTNSTSGGFQNGYGFVYTVD